MFLVRSAFWLTLAFVVMGPKDLDLGATAKDLSAGAISAGQQMLVTEVLKASCTTLDCLGDQHKPVAKTKRPSADIPMHLSSAPVPLPRPRPERMG